MRAVVLVGGFGTRLRPLTYTTPKPLLPVLHVPILERVVRRLAAGGVTEVVLALGFKPDAFRAAYPDGTCAGVGLAYAVESTPLDTAGAIRFAAAKVGVDDTFVVVNGDVLTDLDVGALVARHRATGGQGTIHLTPVEDPSAFGVVPTDDEGRVLAFIEKPTREEAPTNFINAGTYVLEPSVLARIPADRPVSIERETFPALVAEGSLFALATDDYWLDAGRPVEYLRANLDLVDRRADLAPVAPSAVVGTDAKIDRSVIGAGASIGDGACVRGSVLLPGATVGPGARLEDTILGHGASAGRDSELIGCVLGDGARTDHGARLLDVKLPNPD